MFHLYHSYYSRYFWTSCGSCRDDPNELWMSLSRGGRMRWQWLCIQGPETDAGPLRDCSASMKNFGWPWFYTSTPISGLKRLTRRSNYQCVARLEAFRAQATLGLDDNSLLLRVSHTHQFYQISYGLLYKACWYKLQQQFQLRGLIHKHYYWQHLIKLQYQGGIGWLIFGLGWWIPYCRHILQVISKFKICSFLLHSSSSHF